MLGNVYGSYTSYVVYVVRCILRELRHFVDFADSVGGCVRVFVFGTLAQWLGSSVLGSSVKWVERRTLHLGQSLPFIEISRDRQ